MDQILCHGPISCVKYNYSLDLKYQNIDNYQAAISFDEGMDYMTVQVYKPIMVK